MSFSSVRSERGHKSYFASVSYSFLYIFFFFFASYPAVLFCGLFYVPFYIYDSPPRYFEIPVATWSVDLIPTICKDCQAFTLFKLQESCL